MQHNRRKILPDGSELETRSTNEGTVPLTQWTQERQRDMDPETLRMNEHRAMTIPAFFSGIVFLSDAIAGLPKAVYRKNGDTREAVSDHPLNWVLSIEANALNTPFVFWETLLGHAMQWGNGYAYVQRDESLKPEALLHLLPDRTRPMRVEGQQFYATKVDGEWVPIPAADIFHLPGFGWDGEKGYPIVELFAMALAGGKSAEEFGTRFFANGANLGGAIEHPGVMTPEQKKSLRESIDQKHVGLKNAHKWMLLQGGAKLNPLAIAPEQAQFLETRQFSVGDVCRILRVPPHVVYELGRATWGNLEQMGTEVVKYSLQSWIYKSEQEATRKLLTDTEIREGHYVHFNAKGLLRGDSTARSAFYESGLRNGYFNINEVRRWEDLPPIGPEGDVHLVPMNQQNAQAAAEAPTEQNDG